MKIFAANWKLHKNPKETREFFKDFNASIQADAETTVVFFPSAICAEATSSSLTGTPIQWGLQNAFYELKGAFTGENSAQAIKDLGGQWILIGHSERRKIFSESDEWISKKVSTVQAMNLKAMLCIGETLEEREAGHTNSILEKQLVQGLALANKDKELAVAYEPVWAIGTGKVATLEQVAEAHFFVRSVLSKMGFSAKTPILYGGSVKADNAKELIAVPNVDGFLVGGASLEPKSFLEICNCLR